MATRYNLKNIRTLLAEGFTTEELRFFCLLRPQFRPVHGQLAEGSGKSEIVRRLVEYADHKELLDPLLAWAKEQNPAEYNKHQPYHSAPSSSEGRWGDTPRVGASGDVQTTSEGVSGEEKGRTGGSADGARKSHGEDRPETPLPSTAKTDPVQFTTFHPKEIKPSVWYKLLAYTHLSSAIEAVRKDRQARLGANIKNYGNRSEKTTQIIARGAEITIVPELPGCSFNPPRASFLWLEDWHCAEFELQATPDRPGFELGPAVNGRVAFYVESILVAETKIWAHISDDSNEFFLDGQADNWITTEPYQSIFVSYSPQDACIVTQLEKAYTAIGMKYLRDVHALRSGEPRSALFEKIEAADIFQLYWSQAAKQSPNVEQEWRHAVDLDRSYFIRPVYWEKPMPDPPHELGHIHFKYFELNDVEHGGPHFDQRGQQVDTQLNIAGDQVTNIYTGSPAPENNEQLLQTLIKDNPVLAGRYLYQRPKVAQATRQAVIDALLTIITRPEIVSRVRLEAEEVLGCLGDPRLGELVTVPGGVFLMGSSEADKGARNNEKPQHEVSLQAYRIGKYPVTNGRYRRFVEATQREWPTKDGLQPEKANCPAAYVTWHDALAYCAWLTELWRKEGRITSGEVVRLPTEAEWEKAARGTDGRIYPWGDEWDETKCNTRELSLDGTTPVGNFLDGASPYGCLDMVGNVWEWCATRWQKKYPYDIQENEWTDDYLAGREDRVLRGGSFLNSQYYARCACRWGHVPYGRSNVRGLRIVVSPISLKSRLKKWLHQWTKRTKPP